MANEEKPEVSACGVIKRIVERGATAGRADAGTAASGKAGAN